MKTMNVYAFADEASGSIDKQIVAMKRNGLQGLEIRNVDGTNVSDITLEKAEEVHKKLSEAGLKVWSIGSPIGKIGIGDDFEAHMVKFKHTLEVAKALECKNIRLFSFFMPGNEEPEKYHDEVIRRLKAMVEAAKDSGIDLCHENEKDIYGDIAKRCLEIHKEVPELKGIFDPANFIQCGQDTLEAWEMLHPYIKYLHIKDAKENGMVVPAGAGIGNLREIVNKFRAQGGENVTIEPHLTVFEGLRDLEAKDREHEQAIGQLEQEKQDAVSKHTEILSEYEAAQTQINRLAYERGKEIDPEDYQRFLEGMRSLTPAERKVFHLYLEGRSSKEILELMTIKDSTLRYHNRNIYQKLGVNSLKQMLRYGTLVNQKNDRERGDEG